MLASVGVAFGKNSSQYEMAAIVAEAGMVMIQAHTIRRAIPHRTAEKR